MATVESFSEKIQERLQKAQKEKSERRPPIDNDMKQLLERRERFNSAAAGILTSVVYPRMQALSRHFENANVKAPDKAADLNCTCEFSRTRRFPARVCLNIAISPGSNYETLDLHYDLEILPILMKYPRDDEHSFSLDNLAEDEIRQWLEMKLLDFLDTYLQIETHPRYHHDNFVVDPVCGMRIPFFEVAATVEQAHDTIYFCSEVCKEAFLREHR